MTKPMHRTRNNKKIQVKTPSGKTATRYKAKKHSHTECAVCKSQVQGTMRGSKSERSKLTKSQKTVSAPFGGHLCNTCRKDVVEKAALIEAGAIVFEDIDFRLQSYIESATNTIKKVNE